MTLFAVTIMALALAMDAFAVAVSTGIRLQCLNLRILFSQLEQIYIIKQFVNAAGHLVERTGARFEVFVHN